MDRIWRTKPFIHGFIAEAYIDIQAARLIMIDCAEKTDSGANVRTDISAFKVFVPQAFHCVADRAV